MSLPIERRHASEDTQNSPHRQTIDEDIFRVHSESLLRGFKLGQQVNQSEITRLRNLVTELAERDGLTGLYNRHGFLRQLDKRLSQRCKLVVFYSDLRKFKTPNDSLGHEGGNTILQMVAQVLAENTRYSDVLARLGGDEFGIILPDGPLLQIASIARRLSRATREYIRIETLRRQPYIDPDKLTRLDPKWSQGISIGIARSKPNSTPLELLTQADDAMYVAKTKKDEQIHFSVINL